MAWHIHSLTATKAASRSYPGGVSKGGDMEMVQGEGQEQQEQHRELLHVPSTGWSLLPAPARWLGMGSTAMDL